MLIQKGNEMEDYTLEDLKKISEDWEAKRKELECSDDGFSDELKEAMNQEFWWRRRYLNKLKEVVNNGNES